MDHRFHISRTKCISVFLVAVIGKQPLHGKKKSAPIHMETTSAACTSINQEVKVTQPEDLPWVRGRSLWVGVLTLVVLPGISRERGRETSTKSSCSQQDHLYTKHTCVYVYVYGGIFSRIRGKRRTTCGKSLWGGRGFSTWVWWPSPPSSPSSAAGRAACFPVGPEGRRSRAVGSSTKRINGNLTWGNIRETPGGRRGEMLPQTERSWGCCSPPRGEGCREIQSLPGQRAAVKKLPSCPQSSTAMRVL